MSEAFFDKAEQIEEDPTCEADWWSDGYNSGLVDTWEAARKLVDWSSNGGLTSEQLKTIFNTPKAYKVFNSFTASDAINKIHEYEEKMKKKKAEQEIKVGDEVVERLEKSTITFVVFAVSDDLIFGFTENGLCNACYKEEARKTGRHFPQIAEVLEQMKGE